MFNFNQKLFGLVILSISFNATASTSVGCNDSYVSMSDSKLIIEVAPTNDDDTVNLQCALDVATQMGVPVVRLGQGDYYISEIIAYNFNGTLKGRSRSSTRLLVKDFSIYCQGELSQKRISSALKFAGGKPSLNTLQIIAGESCQDGRQLRSVVHFTGGLARSSNCSNEVIFGVVDRVDILNSSDYENGPRAAIVVQAEGVVFPGSCNTNLLGTFRMHRSGVENVNIGAQIAMHGGAQVDVSFNQFTDNLYGVLMRNSNQSTTIFKNTITNSVTDGNESVGVFIISSGVNVPAKNNILVSRNLFEIATDTLSSGWAVVFAQYGDARSEITGVVSGNVFDLQNTVSVHAFDVSNGSISANQFMSPDYAPIIIDGDRGVTDWTITANTRMEDTISAGGDVFLGNQTSLSIVGPNQDFNVEDLGVSNYILGPLPIIPSETNSSKTGKATVNSLGDRFKVPQDVF